MRRGNKFCTVNRVVHVSSVHNTVLKTQKFIFQKICGIEIIPFIQGS